MKKKENMECNQPFFLRSLVNIPPRCMMSTITLQLIAMLTEKQNKQQYESYITSCVHNGSWDMIVSYKEWLETIKSYTPEEVRVGSKEVRTYQQSKVSLYGRYPVLKLSNKDAEKFVDIMENPPELSDNLKNLLLKRKYEYKD